MKRYGAKVRDCPMHGEGDTGGKHEGGRDRQSQLKVQTPRNNRKRVRTIEKSAQREKARKTYTPGNMNIRHEIKTQGQNGRQERM